MKNAEKRKTPGKALAEEPVLTVEAAAALLGLSAAFACQAHNYGKCSGWKLVQMTQREKATRFESGLKAVSGKS